MALLPWESPSYFTGSFPCLFLPMTLSQEWKNVGVEQLRLSTVDMLGIPTLANLQKGVQFALKYRSLGQCVYVHCKAGRSRSATMVAAYLIQVGRCCTAAGTLWAGLANRPGCRQPLPDFRLLGRCVPGTTPELCRSAHLGSATYLPGWDTSTFFSPIRFPQTS